VVEAESTISISQEGNAGGQLRTSFWEKRRVAFSKGFSTMCRRSPKVALDETKRRAATIEARRKYNII